MTAPAETAIVGAGAFGTALALVAARAGRRVTLWGRDGGRMRAMQATRRNPLYLPEVTLPPDIDAIADPDLLRGADLVLFAVPAQTTRATASMLAGAIPHHIPVIACAKGIEHGSGLLQTNILKECLPANPPAVLSGPGFAEEIARGLPTAVTVAAAEMALARRLAATLSSASFRPYASDDPVGVEIAGAVKNVLAIACGVVAGRGLGESARAALIARGLAEMIRLGTALGGRAETFMGLAGIGDLVLTATSAHSRNTAFGMALGRGRSAAALMAAGQPLAEGALTAPVAAALADRHGLEVPIIRAVAAIVDGTATVDSTIDNLVNRPLKAETE